MNYTIIVLWLFFNYYSLKQFILYNIVRVLLETFSVTIDYSSTIKFNYYVRKKCIFIQVIIFLCLTDDSGGSV